MMSVGAGPGGPWALIVRQLIHPLVFPKRRLRLLALLLSSSLVFMLFYLGTKPLSGGLFTHPWDKAVHYLFFGGLCGMFWVLWGGTRLADLLALLMTVAIGIADEWTQAFNPARSSSLGDLAFDFLGAMTAVFVLSQLRKQAIRGHELATRGSLPTQTS